MPVIMKFGGSSLEDAEAMSRSAAIIAKARAEGREVVAVLSAQGGTTDGLEQTAHTIDPSPPARERDSLLSVGEQISTALMAMLLQREGWEAVSLTGWQMGIHTDANHGSAAIERIMPERIQKELAAGRIVLAAGFQGVNGSSDITTLGRGGSDTTAAALAAALGERECLIYTDVAGVYTADPRLVPEAARYEKLTYREMLCMAERGAKVLAAESVRSAMKNNVILRVRSSRGESGESRIVPDEGEPGPRLLAVTRQKRGKDAAVSLIGQVREEEKELAEKLVCEAGAELKETKLTQTGLEMTMPWEKSLQAIRLLHREFLAKKEEKTGT